MMARTPLAGVIFTFFSYIAAKAHKHTVISSLQLLNDHNSWSLSACHYTVSCFDLLRVQSCFDSVYDRYLDTIVLISPFLSPLVTSPTDCRSLSLQGLTSPHSERRPVGLILTGRTPWVKVTTHPHYKKRLG